MYLVVDGQAYREFEGVEEAETWSREYYGDLLALSSENEIHKLISCYTGNCYIPYNELLRACPPLNCDDFVKINFGDRREDVIEIQKINKILWEYTLPENIIVYRFTHKASIRLLCGRRFVRAGIEFSDKAFFSTTLVRSLLEEFRKEQRCNCILKLYLPKGLPGAYVSFREEWSRLNEQEFLLPPNMKFRILKIRYFTYPLEIECMAIPGEH